MGSLEGVPYYAAGVSDAGTMLWLNHRIRIGSSKVSPPKVTQDFFYDVEDPPLPASSAESQAESNYTDGSGALFSMYLNRAEEEDKKAAERWKGDADGILVFVRYWRNLVLYPAGPYIDHFLS
jgi:hypothetical protein